ncbi:MAG: hypothetical protein BalsKO_20580 [Balneolaceae bacterium]
MVNNVLAQSLLLNIDSGFYTDSVEVEADFNSDSLLVYYTLDGSIPDTSDAPYFDPIILKSTSILRTVGYTLGYQDTLYINRTYFLNETTELPAVSIISDPDNLFSNERGIYVEGTNGIPGYCRSTPKNWNQDWERPVYFEFFERDRTKGFNINAGIKIGGGCTRLYDQKSLDIYFRSEYGASKLEYPLFSDKPYKEFDRLSIRSTGQDWYRALIRNAVAQSIVKDRMDLGYQAFKPVVVFINGEYWGIHMLRERQNEDFIESNYGYDENELDILQGGSANVKEGSSDHYEVMLEYIRENDISEKNHYEWVKDQMDIDQYIDYYIAQIYMANGDWPANNIIFWRPQRLDGKWKWLLYDVDMSMGSHSRGVSSTNILRKLTTTTNTPYESTPTSTFLFRSLIKNQDFANKFIQRYSMHIYTTFQPDRMQMYVDSVASLIESEIPAHGDRWEKSMRLGSGMNWEKHLDIITKFINQRPVMARSYLFDFFDLVRLHSVETKVEPPGAGKVYIEGVRSDELNYGLIYQTVPTELKVVAKPGYTFTGWSGDITGNDNIKEISITENSVLTANFVRNEVSSSGVVINEINYRSADTFNAEDWIEFYNNSDELVNMSGWYFSDSDDTHRFTFKEGTIVEPDSYLVLTKDSTLFSERFPQVQNKTGDIDFGLSGDGELIRLFDESGNIVDELTYNDKSPWPAEADGLGATLSLSNPGFDNSKGENWAASSGNGTPGKINSGVFVNNEEKKGTELPSKISLSQNYPNPFNPETTIEYSLDQSTLIRLSVFDLQGRRVATIEDKVKSAGTHRVIWDASNYSSGVYFYRLEANGIVLTQKLTLIK